MKQVQLSPHITDEQLYDLNVAIAREFEVYQFDSTINYYYWNLGIARELQDQYRENESLIALGRVHAMAGYYLDANNMLNVHMVMTIVSAALVVLLPVYSKLLKKINTSVAIEDNGDMDQIDIQD